MRTVASDPELKRLEERVLHYAVDVFERTLPEIRFFILDPMEFASLLLKRVYPTSPVNLWEGKDMVSTRHRVSTGQESSLYYEVVQTGRPSYAYLNETNTPMVQASVMAHVVGHCEFSELNVLHDSNDHRTELVLHLTQKVERCRRQMGDMHYRAYWNAAESIVPLIAPNSQYNLEGSVDTDLAVSSSRSLGKEGSKPLFATPYSHTLSSILQSAHDQESLVREEQKRQARRETLSRHGYKLRAPCQDIMGFLRKFAPASTGERAILDYLYTVNSTQDFVIRTQIMNEGWAMYWEHAIMKELFKEKACTGIVDYCKIFSGVCYPRPYFQRNPYHMGYYLWKHIEDLHRHGRVSLDFLEETDEAKRRDWSRPKSSKPIESMEMIVRTCTDYEFLRRFLTPDLVEELHLNRIPRAYADQLRISARDVVRDDRHYVWINPKPVREEMLTFFTHFHRPRIYLVDVDFMEGGLLLYHRDDGRQLRKKWIQPTLKNINMVWKAPVALLCKDALYTLSAGKFRKEPATAPGFEEVAARIKSGEKPYHP